MADAYTHGHHESVLRSHSWRTAENSAPHLLPLLEPGQRVLDVGCGPGTITIDIAERVAPGEVIGIDTEPQVLEIARANMEKALADRAEGDRARADRAEGDRAQGSRVNASFQQGDAYSLDFPDGAFDVVCAHQVLQHLTDPVAALREMRRVARPGGFVALREGDYGAMTWYPASPQMEDWRALYHAVSGANGCEADAGRRLLSWVLVAGFDPSQVRASAGVWCFAGEDHRWWAQVWAERVVSSDLAGQAKAYGLADDAALEALRAGWLSWGEAPDGWFATLHGQVVVER
jgi:ubiquinone/menaquinone biosynthesis C-methylase UbiE